MAAWPNQNATDVGPGAAGSRISDQATAAGPCLSMPVSRPMPSIGPGCHELRITDSNKIWRIICTGLTSMPLSLWTYFKRRQFGLRNRLSITASDGCRITPEQGEVMNKTQRKRLEDAGWKFGTVQDLLGLSDAEAQLIEIRLALAKKLTQARQRHNVTQKALAKSIGSSQPRVAKIEAGDPSVSLDLLIKASLAAGVTRKELAKVIAG